MDQVAQRSGRPWRILVHRPSDRSDTDSAYEPAIDGLRAVAVALVIAFHFKVPPFQGGFIGVDVFFVISGYLIIGMIVRGLEAGSFSFADFYARRIRRILPAVSFAVFLALLLGVVLFSPADLAALARSALYSLLSVVNYYFLGEVDYFQPPAGSQPLLHLWSLSLEEQMYLVTPALLAGLFLLQRKRGLTSYLVPAVLVALTIASFVLAEVLTRAGSQPAAYYLLPARFGEFCIGGLLTWLPSHRRKEDGQLPWLAATGAVAAGLILIVGAALFLGADSPFPGLSALWPVVGAALVIVGQRGRAPALGLRWSPVRAIGRISYSLYLMHWIAYSFARYWLDRELTPAETILALAATVALSFFSYRFVEEPARRGRRFSRRAVVAACVVATAGLGAAAIAIQLANGLPGRIEPDRLRFAADAAAFHQTEFGGAGYPLGRLLQLGDPSAEPEFLLIGDSKARQFASGLDGLLLSEGRAAQAIFQDGCVMAEGVTVTTQGAVYAGCVLAADLVRETVATSALPVVLSQAASLYRGRVIMTDGRPLDEAVGPFAAAMADAIAALYARQLNAGALVYARSTPNFLSAGLADCLVRPTFIGSPCLAHFDADVDAVAQNVIEAAFLDALSALHPGTGAIDLVPHLCADGICRKVIDGMIVYSDPAHLSRAGSGFVAPYLLAAIDAFLLRVP